MIKFTKNSAIQFSRETLTFNGGELHPSVAWSLNEYLVKVEVEAVIKNANDIMHLLLLKDAIDRFNSCSLECTLILPYVPYARQDRVAIEGEALGIKVMCDLINGMNFDKVVIHDPHSMVATALLNNVRVLTQKELLCQIYTPSGNDIIVAPDLGAVKKAEELAVQWNVPIMYATKHRDSLTGKLSNPQLIYTDQCSKELVYERLHKGGKLIVVDDICDAGGTFMALGAEFLRLGLTQKNLCEATSVGAVLLVTHGIFANSAKTKLASYYEEVKAFHDWTI